MPFNRRGFLSLFCAAPFAAPALAKEAMAAGGMTPNGYMRGISGAISARPLTLRGVEAASLCIKVDTSAIDAALAKMKQMQQIGARVATLDDQAIATWDGDTIPAMFHDSALVAPNRLKGSTINQDGDAT